jgi:hypothetical protein
MARADSVDTFDVAVDNGLALELTRDSEGAYLLRTINGQSLDELALTPLNSSPFTQRLDELLRDRSTDIPQAALKRLFGSVFARPYYSELLQTVVDSAVNGGKRHADMLTYDLELYSGIKISVQQVAQRLRVLQEHKLVSTFNDWGNGLALARHYNPTTRGIAVCAALGMNLSRYSDHDLNAFAER